MKDKRQEWDGKGKGKDLQSNQTTDAINFCPTFCGPLFDSFSVSLTVIGEEKTIIRACLLSLWLILCHLNNHNLTSQLTN